MSNAENEKMEGTIKSVKRDSDGSVKSAFIRPKEGSTDIMFELQNRRDENGENIELTIGTRVQFETVMSPKGPAVKNINIGDREIEGKYFTGSVGNSEPTRGSDRGNRWTEALKEAYHGTIIKINKDNGNGVIEIKNNGNLKPKRLFFHSSATQGVIFNELEIGSKVIIEEVLLVGGMERGASVVKMDYEEMDKK
jgi:cold shock CspA family protein